MVENALRLIAPSHVRSQRMFERSFLREWHLEARVALTTGLPLSHPFIARPTTTKNPHTKIMPILVRPLPKNDSEIVFRDMGCPF